MGDENDRSTPFGVQLPQEIEDLIGARTVKIARRLVRENDRRTPRDRPSDCRALELAAGQLRRPVRGPVAQPDPFEQRVGRTAGRTFPDAGDSQRHRDVFAGGKLR